MGRSVETIRYTLKQFDQRASRIWRFSRTAPVRCRAEAKKKIYQQYRRGAPVDALAKQYCRTKTSIYRVINEMRAARIAELPLDYIPNPQFAKAGAEKEILGPMPTERRRPRRRGCPAACRRTWPACTRCRC